MYAEKADLLKEISEEELIQLTDDEGTGLVNDDVVLDIMDKATSEIDSYLAVRFTLPLSSVPTLLKRICVDISLYYLKMRRGIVNDEDKERKKNSDKLLGLIQSGKLTLGVPQTEEPAEIEGDEIKVSTKDKEFGEDIWDKY